MWEEVGVDQDQLLLRTAELMRTGDPRLQFLSLPQTVMANRSAISRGTVQIFYYLGAGFELMSKVTYQGKRKRYLVCYGVEGNVAPQLALDLIIDNTQQFMAKLGLTEVYGTQPKQIISPLLQQIYKLAAVDSRVQETLLSDMPDISLYRLAYQPTPP